jgi:hypothetical protein
MVRYRSLAELPPEMRGQAEHALELANGPAANDATFKPPRRNKYGNVPVVQDGQKFPSKLQAARNRYHRMRRAAGEIFGHVSEVSIRLPSGKRIRLDELTNEPEPHICQKCGAENLIPTLVFEDAKGVITAEWKVKRAELEAALGVKIRIYKR